jgi:GNAT superfamily N-acetyltransferase
MRIEVREVPETRSAVLEFVKLPRKINALYPNWVAPIYREQARTILTGPFNEIGEKRLFMAFVDGVPMGRISAQINHAHNRHYGGMQGFFGWFESVDDTDVARVLMDAAEAWLKTRGCRDMVGPLSFSIYDEIGVLVDNFDEPPVVLCTYNPPYYDRLLKDVGLEKEMDWYAYLKRKATGIPETVRRIAARVEKQPNVVLRRMSKRNWDQESTRIRRIFEIAWTDNWFHVPFTDRQWSHVTTELKKVFKEEFALALEVNGKRVGFLVSVLDANIALKAANGELYPFGIFKILWNLRKIRRPRTAIMGLLPEYRNRGYDIYMIFRMIVDGAKLGYDNCDCSLIAENNAKMIKALELIGAERYKTYRLYRRVF